MKPYLKIKDCAAESGLSVYFWRELIKAKRIPFVKSGNTFYIAYAEAMEIIRGEAVNEN